MSTPSQSDAGSGASGASTATFAGGVTYDPQSPGEEDVSMMIQDDEGQRPSRPTLSSAGTPHVFVPALPLSTVGSPES